MVYKILIYAVFMLGAFAVGQAQAVSNVPKAFMQNKPDIGLLMMRRDTMPAASVPSSDNQPSEYPSYENCVKSNGGESFKRACNYCRCSSLGYVGCTRMLCPNPAINSATPPQPTGADLNQYNSYDQCVSINGSLPFKRECNSCTCASGGTIACTKMACVKPNLNSPITVEPTSASIDKDEGYEKCVQDNGGAFFKQDCNRCFCGKGGVIGCTLMACPSPPV